VKIDKKTDSVIWLDDIKREEFWKAVDKLLTYGIPKYDDAGHSVEIRFRTPPLYKDKIDALRSEFPDDFFSSNAELYRIVSIIGMRTIIEILKIGGKKEAEKLEQLIIVSNIIGKRARLSQFIANQRKLLHELLERDEDHEEIENIRKVIKDFEKLKKTEIKKTEGQWD